MTGVPTHDRHRRPDPPTRAIDLLADTWGHGRAPRPVRPPAPRSAGLLAPRGGRARLLGRHPPRRRAHGQPRLGDASPASWAPRSSPTQDEESLAQLRLSILNMDPPRHNRARRLVSRAFTPRDDREPDRRHRAPRRAGRSTTSSTVASASSSTDIAAQVPVQMICEMIGLEQDAVVAHVRDLEPAHRFRDDPEFGHVNVARKPPPRSSCCATPWPRTAARTLATT